YACIPLDMETSILETEIGHIEIKGTAVGLCSI
ncbi:MAG: hypothetical protein ACI825_001246, partial [Planctomycetota bacterium]